MKQRRHVTGHDQMTASRRNQRQLRDLPRSTRQRKRRDSVKNSATLDRGRVHCMSRLIALLPKLAVFVVAMVVGGSIAYVVASAANRPQLVPTAGDAPDFKLTHVDSGTVAAFDLIDAPQTAVVLPAMAGGDLTAAADALLDDPPPPGTTPLGFPRVPLVSQFDGGPFAERELHAGLGRDARPPRVRHRHRRLGPAEPPVRLRRRHRPPRPEHRAPPRLRRRRLRRRRQRPEVPGDPAGRRRRRRPGQLRAAAAPAEAPEARVVPARRLHRRLLPGRFRHPGRVLHHRSAGTRLVQGRLVAGRRVRDVRVRVQRQRQDRRGVGLPAGRRPAGADQPRRPAARRRPGVDAQARRLADARPERRRPARGRGSRRRAADRSRHDRRPADRDPGRHRRRRPRPVPDRLRPQPAARRLSRRRARRLRQAAADPPRRPRAGDHGPVGRRERRERRLRRVPGRGRGARRTSTSGNPTGRRRDRQRLLDHVAARRRPAVVRRPHRRPRRHRVPLPGRGRRRHLREPEPGRDVHDRIGRKDVRRGARLEGRPDVQARAGPLAVRPPRDRRDGPASSSSCGDQTAGACPAVIDFGGAEYCNAEGAAGVGRLHPGDRDVRAAGHRGGRRPRPGVPDRNGRDRRRADASTASSRPTGRPATARSRSAASRRASRTRSRSTPSATRRESSRTSR